MRIASVLLPMLVISSPLIQAGELAVAFGKHRPPFVFQSQGEWRGIEVDLVREALAFSGHSIASSIHVSNNRLMLSIATMGLDVAASVLDTGGGSFYSDVYLTYKNYAISRSKKQLNIQSMQDLNKYKVVAWQNAQQNLGENFASIVSPSALQDRGGSYAEYANQEKQNRVFWHDRYQVILVDKHIFLWNKQQLAKNYDTDVELSYHDVLPPSGQYKVAFKSAKIRDDFNLGLQHLQATGKYQQIFARYIKEPR